MGDRSLRRRTGYWFPRKRLPRHTWQSSVATGERPNSVVRLANLRSGLPNSDLHRRCRKTPQPDGNPTPRCTGSRRLRKTLPITRSRPISHRREWRRVEIVDQNLTVDQHSNTAVGAHLDHLVARDLRYELPGPLGREISLITGDRNWVLLPIKIDVVVNPRCHAGAGEIGVVK